LIDQDEITEEKLASKKTSDSLGVDESVDKEEKQEEEVLPVRRRIFEVNTVFQKHQKERRFKNNQVCTSKYTCLTFLPLNLMVQFSKLANSYFLFMMVL